MSARWVSVVVSAWLVCSGVAATGPEQANNLALGLSVFVVAFLAMGLPRLRRVNTALGAWAAISPFALAYRDDLAGWSALLGGIAIVIASLRPDRAPSRHHPAGPPLA
jgi:predicted branched-subunit amino acid permease